MSRIFTFRHVVVVALAAVTTGLLPLGQTQAADTESPFAYAFAFISSVHYAHMVEPYYAESEKSEFLTLAWLNDKRRAAKLAAPRLSDAAALVAPFRNSKTEIVKTSATVAYLAYTRLIEVDQEMLKEFERGYMIFREARMQSVDRGIKQLKKLNVEMTGRLVDLQAEKHEAWLQLLQVSAAVSHALVLYPEVLSPENKNDKIERLRITSDEKRSLIEWLEKLFGQTVKKYVEDDRRAAPAPAVTIYEFLSQPWKGSDVP